MILKITQTVLDVQNINLLDMKINLTLLPILILYSTFLFSQCPKPVKIPYVDGTTASYFGETNDNCNPNGEGKLVYDDPSSVLDFREGSWIDGEQNGQGKWVYSSGDIFSGLFENDKLVKGEYISDKNETSIKYNGSFNGIYFQGPGLYKEETDKYILIREGDFISDNLADGLETRTNKNDGVIIISEYINGISKTIKRNDVNSYNKLDIMGDNEFIELDLIKKGSIFDNRVSYHIDLEIDGIKGEWILDTGAMSFTIGKTLFNRMEKAGVEFIDLNKKVVSQGIGGVSNGKKVILNNIKIGDYFLNNVVATVSLDNNYSLLGTGFLLKFKNAIWKMQQNKLLLYK